ncbi:metallophosphoesterase family protein [Stutzerimonas nitrititolerans]|uniref:metallophosphoesterase family protein n=1 Tax=Stutzerimonas nitrititolerans TaxID=2482751 RepID=UPI001BD2A53C|nr:metallophosphoesterase family protein [Stutzerimonas nitrititolerans]
MRIGVISDTHGLLRPEALAVLEGCERIIHAGDIGKPQVLTALQAIAPLEVIRGNIDKDDWAEGLPERLELDHGGVRLYVLHDLKTLDFDPAARGIGVVISGHSHKPGIERRGEVLYLNPGSAGPRRFSLPISLALLDVENGSAHAELVALG